MTRRRLVLVLVTAGLLGGGLVGSAAASDTRDHKVCVNLGSDGLLPPGYCVAWNDPLAGGQ